MDTEREDPVVDLPPPPASERGPDGGEWTRERPRYTDPEWPQSNPGRAQPREERRSGGRFFLGCFTGCLLAVLLPPIFGLLFVILGTTSLVKAFSSGDLGEAVKSGMSLSSDEDDFGVDDFPSFHEVWSCGDDDDDSAKVVRIPLRGEIFFEEGRLKQSPALLALQSIRRATIDDEVRAIILEIDSPGGGVTASDVLCHALEEFRDASTNRVVVVVMEDICASGGYYVAAAADMIVAHPTTITGSIGVIITSFNVKELADRLGIKDVSIASGENKQMLSPLHDLTPEQRAMLQESVNALNRRFVKIVADGRRMTVEDVEKVADGRVFLAEEARKLGLVDDIGYFNDALDDLAELLGTDSLHVVRYERKTSFRDLFDSDGIWDLETQLRRLESASGTRLLYKWR